MENVSINFSYNWNCKLNNKAFTTIRIHNQLKYQVGKTYQVFLNGRSMGKAILKEKRVLGLNQLNNFICYIDTGYNQQETLNILKQMYRHINLQTVLFDFCLLVYIKPSKQEIKEMQRTLEL